MNTPTATDLALQADAVRLRARRTGGLLVALGALAIIGSWWLVPQSMIAALTAADPTIGTVNVIIGVVSLLSGIALIVVGIRVQRGVTAGNPESNYGNSNPRFDNPGAPTPNGQPPLNWGGLTTY